MKKPKQLPRFDQSAEDKVVKRAHVLIQKYSWPPFGAVRAWVAHLGPWKGPHGRPQKNVELDIAKVVTARHWGDAAVPSD